MEYFDVYNKNRKLLGYEKKRGDLLNDNEYNIGTELWIINDNKILMTKRSKNKSHPLMWEVPGGCSIKGESTVDTIIREIKEEIGINIKEEDISLIGTVLYKKQFVDIYKTEKSIDTKETLLQSEEIDNISFVTKEEFNNMVAYNKIVPSVINRFNIIKDNLKLDW